MEKQLKHVSKLMSLVLRHKPEEIGLHLDENGWADVQELIDKLNGKGLAVDALIINEIVATNDKNDLPLMKTGVASGPARGIV